ncbi:DUF5994 family protein [Mycobacterium sp. BMJ-28]
MTVQETRKNAQGSTVPARTPRLRLKAKGPRSGYVDGAWWPHSDDLTSELPALLAVLSVRLGRVDRVLYDLNAWARAPRKFVSGEMTVHLDGYRLQPEDTIEIIGLDGDRITLLVLPPHTDADDAHTAMMAAAQSADASTVTKLLMTSAHERGRRTMAFSAQERWESEGGTTTLQDPVQMRS